ncbi:multidrug effflux MFS transporter [Actinosynnema sp. NPDC047251]|uniref:Drug resistance transporter, Bcr/CflA subfamily n=1 Tax=Saccharothrix espanaensis (strain ATCC 51144 / DSM 44229 / JCM 9112 / NBRC 15066 / NRRL 15764) TaxID=1179773 RepID=K0JZQ3_SACES|nr:multidrug effflux MFS transporter [Saccharothrix espanaensis]CCH30777.1 Drug resistance transporter, Bcr/CflA subfamily [Saccharothrix espanaensis DSM 44229]
MRVNGPPRTRRLLLLLGALSTFGPLSIDLYLPALPALARNLDATDDSAQWSISACMIGLALGQLFIGPLSDKIGRKRPLFIGVATYTVASLLCATAPSITVLIVLRLVQGLAGSAGMVAVEAMVRDLYEGRQMARILSLLMLVGGCAPIVAPVLGGQLLHFTDWRGLFVLLAVISALLLLAVIALPETLRPELRHAGGLRRVRAGFSAVVRDRMFVGCTLGTSIGSIALFIYISISSFVLEGGYGVSPQVFSLIFAVNSVGLVLGGWFNSLLLRRFTPERLLVAEALVALVASVLSLVAALLHAPLAVFLPVLFLTILSGGLASPNATALALTRHPANAGTAAALLGSTGFLFGALFAPLASLGGASAIAMTAGIAIARVGSWLAYALVARPQRATPDPAPCAGG